MKYVYSIVVCIMLILTACGSGSTTKETKDSTTVAVDTVGAKPADTVKVN